MNAPLPSLRPWLFALGLIGAVNANAQTSGTEGSDVSAEAIEKFATAYVAVQMINQEYGARLQEVEDQDESTRLQRRAQNQMQQAVIRAGLSIAEYQTIAKQANSEEKLRERIEAAVAAQVEE